MDCEHINQTFRGECATCDDCGEAIDEQPDAIRYLYALQQISEIVRSVDLEQVMYDDDALGYVVEILDTLDIKHT